MLFINAFVIIPAYQPDETLYTLVQAELAYGNRVVVVNDGSDVACQALFDRVATLTTVLTHAANRGKGESIKTALRYVAEQSPLYPDCTAVGVMDADGQHLPEDMETVLEAARQYPDSLVLGVRQIGGKMPLRSRIGNAITRRVFKWLSGVYVSDTQTGLRAFSVTKCAMFAAVKGERYEYESNWLMMCARQSIPFREVPIHTVYLNRANTSSHFRPVSDSVRIYKDLLKFVSSSLTCFGIDYVLFCLFYWLLGALTWGATAANVIARLFSGTCNYLMNCRLVFGQKPTVRSALQYAALAVFILLVNSAVLELYITLLGLPAWLAKLLTEICMFLFNFAVQRLLIFRRKHT